MTSDDNDEPARSMTEIAGLALAADAHRFPDTAVSMIKLSLFDWTAVAIAGRDEPVSKIVRDAALADKGEAQSSVIGSATRLPARAAALVNGTVSHALDYDDTHFLHVGHTSVAVFPACLAVAEKSGASAKAFLAAALVGSECACRIGGWLGREHYQAGFHQTATSGTFGAAIAVARLLGLSKHETEHALGLASTRASGLKSQFGTMGKPYHAGLASANAVEVAELAKQGFVSNPGGLDGPLGFAATHAARAGDTATWLADFGDVFLVEGVSHKLHACCHGLHSAIEALNALKSSHDIHLDDISSVQIRTNPRWLDVCNIAAPRTALEAKFSFRLTTAMALSGLDTAALSTFSDDACRHPGLIALSDKVSVTPDAELSDTVSVVEVALCSGDTISADHDLTGPMRIEDRTKRLRRKSRALLGAPLAERTWQIVDDLEVCGIGALCDVVRSA